MSGSQRIVPIRRAYNRFVADETLEDYALRFTAKKARRWSGSAVAQTALGSVSFLALEAIGGTLVLTAGFTNALAAILFVGLVIFATAAPITVYAARHGVDMDLLTRGAGFGYLGSTVTSLIYASFTFLFFAIEAAIMALALQICLGLPLWLGYLVCAGAVIPLVAYGIRLISRFQIWTQPLWIGLNLLPLVCIAAQDPAALGAAAAFPGLDGGGSGFDLVRFGAATGVLLALLAQVGEQVDFLRFVPEPASPRDRRWWLAVLAGGAGWILPGMAKILLGAGLAVLALAHGVPPGEAAEPTQMYRVAFGYVAGADSRAALLLMGAFVLVSQLKINLTNAYAGSIAWSNFFSRLTHSHPGRVVWLVFNVAIAVLLMMLGIDKTIGSTLPLYACVVSAWVGALAADLAVNKPLRLSPPGIEFKRAHLYAVNPVGTGAMLLALTAGCLVHLGLAGPALQPFAPLLTLAIAFCAAPAIAWATGGRWYLARRPRRDWGAGEIACRVCELPFEGEDMAHCPAYDAPICSLCCSLDARCADLCKPHGRLEAQAQHMLGRLLPRRTAAWIGAPLGRYLAVMLTLCAVIGLILAIVHAGASLAHPEHRAVLRAALTSVFFTLVIILGVVAWLFVLAQESRRVAQAETLRQTALYEAEIAAHRITDAKLQEAKERAEAANHAKSRYVVGLSHELRTPLSSVLGYAQLLETDPTIPPARLNGIRVIRRSAQHLSGLIDRLLDISRMEAGRLQLNRDEVRLADFLDQLADMVRLQAREAGLDFRFTRPEILPQVVATDEKRLRQVLLNLLSNAIKFTPRGTVSLDLSYRSQVAVFTIHDTGPGIPAADLARIFEPFERGSTPAARRTPGTGLGLTIANLLAQLLGGEIALTAAPGGGTQARLRLMLAAVAQPALAPAPAARAEPVYAGLRRTVLVVDDDPAHRTLMGAILEPLGLTVREAGTGAACLACVAEAAGGIDLIVLDIAMPGMSGWDVAETLRARGHAGPIAMMSANVHELGPVRGDSPPHNAILAKPFDLRDVRDRTMALLRLDWTDADAAALPAAAVEAVPAAVDAVPAAVDAVPAAVRPGADHVGELLRLGRIGHIRGIEAKLSAMEQDGTGPQTFVAQMRGLIAGYDLRRYLAVLTELVGDD